MITFKSRFTGEKTELTHEQALEHALVRYRGITMGKSVAHQLALVNAPFEGFTLTEQDLKGDGMGGYKVDRDGVVYEYDAYEDQYKIVGKALPNETDDQAILRIIMGDA